MVGEVCHGRCVRFATPLRWKEIDIWRTAKLLMTQHGDAAGFAAAKRADAMFSKNDHAGVAVWMRISRAIEELERQKPREGEAVNDEGGKNGSYLGVWSIGCRNLRRVLRCSVD